MKRMLFGVVALVAGGLAAGGAYAHEGLTGVAHERHELMESMADAMQSMGNMVRGIEEYNADRMRTLAGEIAAAGGDKLVSLFPEGSYDPAGEALPAIWEDFERFSALSQDLTEAAETLAEAADTPPAPPSAAPPDPSAGGGAAPAMDAGTALFGVGMSCKACHDDFREEDS
ncbi:c-type cytochrome [Candidatus Foliamicus sp.]